MTVPISTGIWIVYPRQANHATMGSALPKKDQIAT